MYGLLGRNALLLGLISIPLTLPGCADGDSSAAGSGNSVVDAAMVQPDVTTSFDAGIPDVQIGFDANPPVVDAGPIMDAEVSLDDFIRMLGQIESDEPSKVAMDPGEPFEEGDYRCTTRQVSETQRHEQMVAYQANSESLWPGALIRGSAVADGLLTQVVTERSPLSFSVSLQNLEGSNSARMDLPSLSSYRDKLQEILSAGVSGATPAFVFSEIEEVHSANQLGIQLGLDVSGLTGMVSSSFDFQNEDKRSRFVVNFVQAYYTVDVDPPRTPSGFFPSDVTRQELEDAFGGNEGGPPLYVSSITYGRRVIFTAESSVSMSELRSALDFAYNGGAIDIDGSVSLTHREVLETTSMTAFILGGSGEQAVRAINGLDDLREFIQTGGNYSPDSPGAPIAYKLAHLSDNSSARMSFTTDYVVKECERVSQRVLVTLMNITTVDGGRQVKIYGDIFVTARDRNGEGNRVTLFNVSSGDAFELDEGQTWPNMGHAAQGVLNVRPANGENITLEVHLHDKDWPSRDDDADVSARLPFESGWRHECETERSGGYVAHAVGSRVHYDARFCLQPIP